MHSVSMGAPCRSPLSLPKASGARVNIGPPFGGGRRPQESEHTFD
jgi:hypothetical protein